MGRGGRWDTWRDEGRIGDIEQGGGAQRYLSHLLETLYGYVKGRPMGDWPDCVVAFPRAGHKSKLVIFYD